jgi:hypothetical protein
MRMVHRTVTMKRYNKHKIKLVYHFFTLFIVCIGNNKFKTIHQQMCIFLHSHSYFFIKNNENSFMFRPLRDYHQGIRTSIAYSFSNILTLVNISCLLGTDKFYIVHSMHW